MAVSRRCATAMVPFLCAVLLSGCAPPGEPSLTSSERDIIRAEIDDDNWRAVAFAFPQALRPEVHTLRTINERSWSDRMESCLAEAGFGASAAHDHVFVGPDSKRSAIGYAIASYECRTKYPTLSHIVQYLDRRQLLGLYTYYLGSVRPCLLLAGAPSPRPPSQLAYVISVFSIPEWHPFQQVWDRGTPDSRLRYLEQRCPPIPPWLDLRE